MKRLICWSVVTALAAAGALAQQTKPPSVEDMQGISALAGQLLTVEKRFWESWKNHKPEAFQELMTDDAVFFGQYGVASKAEIIDEQKGSVQSCTVESYALTNPCAIPIDATSAILLYEAEQHATCGGVKVQPFMHGSSVYVRHGGKWMSVYRSEVPPAK
jgi:hypothetical protein